MPEKLKRKTRHSPAGKLYLELGEEETVKHYARRHRIRKLKRRIAAVGKATSHAKGMASTTKPSGPLPFKAWQKEYGGRSPMSDVRGYRAYKKNWGKK